MLFRFRNKSVTEIYNMISTDPNALRAAKQRLITTKGKETALTCVIKQAILQYEADNKNITKVKDKNLKLKNLSLDELVTLITSNTKALESVRQAISRNRNKDNRGYVELYQAALDKRSLIIKNERLKTKMESIEKEILKLSKKKESIEKELLKFDN